MPSLDEILSNGSDAFRRLNRAATGQVQAPARVQPAPARAVAAPAHNPEPKPDLRPALGKKAQAADRSGRSPAPRPHLHFHLFRVRLLDGDNKNASIKFLQDFLRYANLITDDRECDIRVDVTQHQVSSHAREGVGIVITYS